MLILTYTQGNKRRVRVSKKIQVKARKNKKMQVRERKNKKT